MRVNEWYSAKSNESDCDVEETIKTRPTVLILDIVARKLNQISKLNRNSKSLILGDVHSFVDNVFDNKSV